MKCESGQQHRPLKKFKKMVDGPCVTNQMKAIEQYLNVALFIKENKILLTFPL